MDTPKVSTEARSGHDTATWAATLSARHAGAAEETAAMLPIRVTAAENGVSKPAKGGAELELLLAQGHRVRVRGAVEPAVLRAALEVMLR